MGKASRAKQERREARGAKTTEEILSELRSMKPGEVLMRSFFPTSEAQTIATTPKKMLEEALRHGDMMGVMSAKLSCDIMGKSITDFKYPGTPGFYSDSQGSVYDVAFHYGATDGLRFLCKEGFQRNDEVLLEITRRLFDDIDNIGIESPNYLPASIVMEAYLREIVRRYGVEIAKMHVEGVIGGWLVCRRAITIMGDIEMELNGAHAHAESIGEVI